MFDWLTGPETVETKSQYKPSAQERPIYDMIFSQMQDVMGNPQTYYPGQGYVGMSDNTQQGINSMMGAAEGIGGMISPFQQSWQRNLNASDISNNQNVQDMMASNAQMANQNLQRNMLPSIQQGAIQGGGMNNARQGLAQGVAMGDTSQAITNANAQTQMQAYLAGLQAEQGAMGQAGNLAQLQMMPGQLQTGAGQLGEYYEQQKLNDAMARHYFPQQEAMNRLNFGMGGLQNLRLGTQTGQEPNPGYTSLGNMAGNLIGGWAGGGFKSPW